jgi:hypothetical protein
MYEIRTVFSECTCELKKNKLNHVYLLGLFVLRWMVTVHRFRTVKDKEGIKDPKSSLKMLIFPNYRQFGSKFCIRPDETAAFLVNTHPKCSPGARIQPWTLNLWTRERLRWADRRLNPTYDLSFKPTKWISHFFICNIYHKVIWSVPRQPLWVHRLETEGSFSS